MKKDKWITITELIDVLRNDPGNEHQCCRGCGILRSTHWMRYDAEKDMFINTTYWPKCDWYTEEEILQLYDNWLWMIES